MCPAGAGQLSLSFAAMSLRSHSASAPANFATTSPLRAETRRPPPACSSALASRAAESATACRSLFTRLCAAICMRSGRLLRLGRGGGGDLCLGSGRKPPLRTKSVRHQRHRCAHAGDTGNRHAGLKSSRATMGFRVASTCSLSAAANSASWAKKSPGLLSNGLSWSQSSSSGFPGNRPATATAACTARRATGGGLWKASSLSISCFKTKSSCSLASSQAFSCCAAWPSAMPGLMAQPLSQTSLPRRLTLEPE
mmetsp:Transcript_3032/g.9084  ORF Transcript_3032/g.9084 Transcript_3032/m.9084 type:complete len:253 (+) Transcript_3032:571-1329(+)